MLPSRDWRFDAARAGMLAGAGAIDPVGHHARQHDCTRGQAVENSSRCCRRCGNDKLTDRDSSHTNI